jgi:hypothetical protein
MQHLLLFHGNNSCTNALQFYIIGILPVVLILLMVTFVVSFLTICNRPNSCRYVLFVAWIVCTLTGIWYLLEVSHFQFYSVNCICLFLVCFDCTHVDVFSVCILEKVLQYEVTARKSVSRLWIKCIVHRNAFNPWPELSVLCYLISN